jgi:hypothetical protein
MSVVSRKAGVTVGDSSSLTGLNMSFLLEDVDRSSYDKALQYIQPLSELEDIFEDLPSAKSAMREAINRVNTAITSDPDPILSSMGLSDSQKELIDACTSVEVLKLSMLNAFDAVRQLLITDFSKTPKVYEEEAIEIRVIPSGRVRTSAEARTPKRVPFSVVSGMNDYAVHWQDGRNMIIGPDNASGRLYDLSWTLPRTTATIRMANVPVGKIYLVARVEGDPAPVTPEKKRDILGIPLTPKGALARTLDDLSTDTARGKTFDLEAVVRNNFKIPAPAMGFVESIYRKMRSRPAVQRSNLDPTTLAAEMKGLTLEKFRNYFRELVERTTTATGDITTYDVADTLFFGGLAWVSGLLGITNTPSAPGGPAAPGGAGSSPGGTASGGSGGAEVRHSLGTVLSDPTIAAGSTPAERAANLSNLRSSINQDELRKNLNRLTAGRVVFTEGTVDRWCELAGIKEGK